MLDCTALEGFTREITDFFSSSVFGFLLKFLSGFSAAGFGIMGIGTKTRTDDGRLTRSGRIALIGVLVSGAIASISSVYDFTTGEQKAAKEHKRADLLLLSAQRSIYPFRDFAVSVVLPLDDNGAGLGPYGRVRPFGGLERYKQQLRRALLEDRFCKDPARCSSSASIQDPDRYSIPISSPLFPSKTSTVYIVATNMQVGFRLLKENLVDPASGPVRFFSNVNAKYSAVGDFMVTWHNHLPNDTTLDYEFKADRLLLHIRGAMVSRSDIESGGVFSLVDFNPGMIGGYAWVSDHGICDDLHLDTVNCGQSVLYPLRNALSVISVQIDFPYPKNIKYYEGDSGGTQCDYDSRKFLVHVLGFNVEEADSLANITTSPDEKNEICADFKSAEPRNFR
jgi:hypothetical protein